MYSDGAGGAYGGPYVNPNPYGMRPPPARGPFVSMQQPVMAQPPPPPKPMIGYGGTHYPRGWGLWDRERPKNLSFPAKTVIIMCFVILTLAILLVVAQMGYYSYCAWNGVCLAVPTFVACNLFIISSIIGIAAGLERSTPLIGTLMVMSIITVFVTPINMGLWGLPANKGGVPIPFNLVGDGSTYSDTLAAIHWALLFIPILLWILFIIIIIICAHAVYYSGHGGGRSMYGGRPKSSCRTYADPGNYAPSPLYSQSPVYNQSPRPYFY